MHNVICKLCAAFLTSFDSTFKFEIRQTFCHCSKSASDFFSMVDSIATFKTSGITPIIKNRLTILAIVGSSTVKQPFKTTAGRGSSSQDLDIDFLDNFFISSWVASAKLQNSAPPTVASGRGRPNAYFPFDKPMMHFINLAGKEISK